MEGNLDWILWSRYRVPGERRWLGSVVSHRLDRGILPFANL